MQFSYTKYAMIVIGYRLVASRMVQQINNNLPAALYRLVPPKCKYHISAKGISLNLSYFIKTYDFFQELTILTYV